MASPVLVSVVICTRNRAASLARTLESLVRAESAAHAAWELIVVDNGSTDETKDTIEGFVDRLPVRRVWQPVAGLSNARNAGVLATRGDYIVWTDDDVIVHEGWLAAWCRAFREYPDEALFGGRTEPLYEEPSRDWFVQNQGILASLLAIRDEPGWREVTTHRIPFGLNYAVRAAEQRGHLYDPELGVAPGRRRGGEETAVLRAILAEGGTGRWIWDATVYHIIPVARQSTEYIATYHEALGYDFPISTAGEGAVQRLRAIWRAAKVWARTGLAYRRTARADLAAAVPLLIEHAKARGTIKRHLGVREL